jgi:hypothetical protein
MIDAVATLGAIAKARAAVTMIATKRAFTFPRVERVGDAPELLLKTVLGRNCLIMHRTFHSN